jgi:hypothetical protein
MHEEETIKQPQEQIKLLELENELLKAKIRELEATKESPDKKLVTKA